MVILNFSVSFESELIILVSSGLFEQELEILFNLA